MYLYACKSIVEVKPPMLSTNAVCMGEGKKEGESKEREREGERERERERERQEKEREREWEHASALNCEVHDVNF